MRLFFQKYPDDGLSDELSELAWNTPDPQALVRLARQAIQRRIRLVEKNIQINTERLNELEKAEAAYARLDTGA